MKTIKGWDDVTYTNFMAITAIVTNKELDDLDKTILIYSELTETPIEEIREKPIGEIKKLTDSLEFMNKPCPEKHPRTVKVNGREYSLTINPEHLTVAQYIDFSTQFNKRDKEDNTAEILSVFIIPINHTYNDGYDMEEVVNDIMDLPYPIINGMSAFFLMLYQLLMDSLRKTAVKKMRKALKSSINEEEKKKLKEAIKQLNQVVFGFQP